MIRLKVLSAEKKFSQSSGKEYYSISTSEGKGTTFDANVLSMVGQEVMAEKTTKEANGKTYNNFTFPKQEHKQEQAATGTHKEYGGPKSGPNKEMLMSYAKDLIVAFSPAFAGDRVTPDFLALQTILIYRHLLAEVSGPAKSPAKQTNEPIDSEEIPF